MIFKKMKKAGLEKKRQRYGYTFVFPWIIGLIMFFVFPLLSSLRYAFSKVSIEAEGVLMKFTGFANISKLLFEDPNYINWLRDSLGFILYSLPVIIALSLILAYLLNQKFIGRTAMRAIFFLPIIILTSAVLPLMAGQLVRMPILDTSTEGSGFTNYDAIIVNLNIPEQLQPVFTFLMSGTIRIVWSCGVQTILFLAGLQSIPASLFEASKIEGANKWEELWMVTIPHLRHVISLVLIYTMIDLFTSNNNRVVERSYYLMLRQNFSTSSAMLWFYFIIIIAIIGTVYALYHRFLIRRWE